MRISFHSAQQCRLAGWLFTYLFFNYCLKFMRFSCIINCILNFTIDCLPTALNFIQMHGKDKITTTKNVKKLKFIVEKQKIYILMFLKLVFFCCALSKCIPFHHRDSLLCHRLDLKFELHRIYIVVAGKINNEEIFNNQTKLFHTKQTK